MQGARWWGIVCLAVAFGAASPASGLTIDLQFAAGTMFTPATDVIAQEAIAAAANDLELAITTVFPGIPSDVLSSTVGVNSATFNWNGNYVHPVTAAPIAVPDATLAADTVKIFVNTANLTGTPLGQGGPSIGFGLMTSFGGPNVATEFPAAVTNAANLSEAAYSRGGNGPIQNTFSGVATAGAVSAPYSIDVGINFGNLWFDVDTDNSGAKDSDGVLENFWHFDHTTAVPVGKRDLYSVALHEILHALGVGTSDTWDAQRSGTTWNGPEVLAITGSGVNLVSADGAHIASNTMSFRISDGAAQEVVMDPSLTVGTRKSLTELDLAFLRDINYETIEPPSSDFDGDDDVDVNDLAIWNAAYDASANGDADGDGDSDGADFLIWQQEYTGPLSFAAGRAVPEPASLALLVSALFFCRTRLGGRSSC